MKSNKILIVLMVIALFILRGTRTPNSVGMTVLLWSLSFVVVASTLAFVRFPNMRWTRITALGAMLGILLVPPVPNAWLVWIPDALSATSTLAFFAVLYAPSTKRAPSVDGRKGAAVTMDEVLLGVALLLIGAAPELLARYTPGQLSSLIEWAGAWGPVFGAVPVLVALGAYALVRAGLAKKNPAGGKRELERGTENA